jgi:hypothetical protein
VKRKGTEQQQPHQAPTCRGWRLRRRGQGRGSGSGLSPRTTSTSSSTGPSSLRPPPPPPPPPRPVTPLPTPGGSLRPRVLFHRAAPNPSSPRRYAPGTILTALQEVAQHAEGRRIDWRAVVGKSATGITSAREYQMLWRHFAYNHVLDDTVDAGDQPLVRNRTRSSKPRFGCSFRLACKVPMIELGFL